MNKSILKKIGMLSIFCLALTAFGLQVPMTCYGQDEVVTCPMRIEVSPYQVNIDARGAAHYVRVLTYTWYSNTAEAFVYINDYEDPIDPDSIVLTRDSIGHLVVKIDLDALQDAELEPDTYHDLKIVVELKEVIDGCDEKEGIGYIYIIGKNGP